MIHCCVGVVRALGEKVSLAPLRFQCILDPHEIDEVSVVLLTILAIDTFGFGGWRWCFLLRFRRRGFVWRSRGLCCYGRSKWVINRGFASSWIYYWLCWLGWCWLCWSSSRFWCSSRGSPWRGETSICLCLTRPVSSEVRMTTKTAYFGGLEESLAVPKLGNAHFILQTGEHPACFYRQRNIDITILHFPTTLVVTQSSSWHGLLTSMASSIQPVLASSTD